MMPSTPDARRAVPWWAIATPAAIAALGLAAGLAGTALALAQAPTFSTRVDAVRVDALVTNRGRPVLGLTKDDFELLDNGVAQRIEWVDVGDLPVNVVLVLDTSDSVTGPLLAHLRTAGEAVLDALRPGDQVAVLGFSHLVAVGGLTNDLARAREALTEPGTPGQTALVDAVLAALLVAASDAGRGLVMVFSDGLDTASWLEPATVLDAAQRGQAVVYAVATKRAGRDTFLRDVTADTGGALWSVESTDDLARHFVAIVEEFRHRYLLAYTPQGVSSEGWHRLTLRVKGRRATVHARPGYLAGGS